MPKLTLRNIYILIIFFIYIFGKEIILLKEEFLLQLNFIFFFIFVFKNFGKTIEEALQVMANDWTNLLLTFGLLSKSLGLFFLDFRQDVHQFMEALLLKIFYMVEEINLKLNIFERESLILIDLDADFHFHFLNEGELNLNSENFLFFQAIYMRQLLKMQIKKLVYRQIKYFSEFYTNAFFPVKAKTLGMSELKNLRKEFFRGATKLFLFSAEKFKSALDLKKKEVEVHFKNIDSFLDKGAKPKNFRDLKKTNQLK